MLIFFFTNVDDDDLYDDDLNGDEGENRGEDDRICVFLRHCSCCSGHYQELDRWAHVNSSTSARSCDG